MSTAVRPLLPPIRLRVGVTGHRIPPRLAKQSELPLRANVDRILAAIIASVLEVENDYAERAQARDARRKYSTTRADVTKRAAECVIVSSLAEGSDSIVAEAGLAAGCRLEGVLPFSRGEYMRDFATEEARERFDRLLARASAVFELEGGADARPRAYQAAGFVMLANIDLLLAIWDGNEAAGIGGTAQIVSRAIADGIPIIWIDPNSSDPMKISQPRVDNIPLANAGARPKDAFRSTDERSMAPLIREIVALPAPAKARKSLDIFLAERTRRWNLCPWYPLLLWLFSGRAFRAADFHFPPVTDSAVQWQRYLMIVPKDRSQRPTIENLLIPAFAVTDHLAVYYSLVYRSTYVFNFLFAASAVGLALGEFFIREDPAAKSDLVVAELLVISAILITWFSGYRKELHRRWLDYRRLAECLRHMRILSPMGAAGPVDRPGRSLDMDEADWVDWYARSLRRALPLPDRVVDAPYLAAMREAVCSTELASQIQYHAENADRIAKLDARMHHGGQILFATTAAFCVVFLCLQWFRWLPSEPSKRVLVLATFSFLTALFPTFGAALGAIHAQGDFKTVAERSKRTAKRLAALAKILTEEPLTFGRLTDRIVKASDIMIADLLEWQTVFRTRPLSLPA